MSDKTLVKAIGVGLACSITFIAGYVFRAVYTGDNQPIMAAIHGANAADKVLYSGAIMRVNVDYYDDLESVKSLEEVDDLKRKYRELALRSAQAFESDLAHLEGENIKRGLKPMLDEAKALRKRLENAS